MPIEPASALRRDARAAVRGPPPDITEENIQARIRGVILMAISNKFGPMVLTTGNKSEMSVGYATLYGDMCGGYSVLKDVYKTTVFALSRWRNQQLPADARGPARRGDPGARDHQAADGRAAADQKDQDSLPPYDELDAILQGLVEQDLSARELVAKGHDPAVVRKVSNMLDLAEYKRRQAPPGVKITRKAFGRDRRYPITNAFRKLGLSGQGWDEQRPDPAAERAAGPGGRGMERGAASRLLRPGALEGVFGEANEALRASARRIDMRACILLIDMVRIDGRGVQARRS